MSTPEMNLNTMEEVMSLVENVTMDDFSVDLTPDDAVAQDTIKKTVVGKFFIKRKIGNGKLRSILSEMWNISPGWRLQEISPKIFIFRFSRESDALKVVGNGPWAPCGGFLLVTLMPDDGKWKSADLNHVNIWVRALGVPYRYFTDEIVEKIANRVGKCLSTNKMRVRGVLRSNFMRFRVSLDLAKPLLAGVGLDDEDGKKVWSYFKYERLPLFCFKCGCIGHLESSCSAGKRMMSLDDGRSVPLFGPWLRFGSRLENGFAVLDAEDFKERTSMEQEDDPLLARGGHDGGSAGMTNRIIQKSDNSFNVPSHEKTLPQSPTSPSDEPLIGLITPLNRARGKVSSLLSKGRSRMAHKNSHSRMLGPRGIPKKPIFGNINDLDKSVVGTKRKKISDGHNEFEGDNLKTNPGLEIDRGPKDVFAEGSSISGHPLGDERAAVKLGERNLGLMEDNGKKRKAGADTEVREGQGKDDLGRGCDDHLFQEIRGTRNRGGKSNKPESLLALEQDDGLFEDEEVAKSESRPDPESGLPTGEHYITISGSMSLVSDANVARGRGEKFGGTSGSHGDFEDLSNFLLMTGGVDLGSVGNFYTWTNNRKFSALIKERLDRETQIDGNLVLNHVGETPPIPSAVDLLGEFNVFVDAAVKDNMAFLAVLSLDKQGEVIEAFSVKTWVKSPLEAETMAICHAISRCQEHGWMNACIFLDCKVAVEAAAARKVPCWKSTAWFLHLFNRLEVAVNTKVVWIPHSLNSNAHLLAKWAASHNFSNCFSLSVLRSILAMN
ncbi:hypothetical protein G4B88_014790 [Cannabis sativa]|uniref:CCHC-type domain-containing protein n=1 Tax=Cannabis sativa TaxID=3483 RepID=A0A7J6I9R3_CANSA|nr:hypothetical protein G4B88_014790 [Cannabis sativa]